ncbi:MAG: hypothetical protein JRM99_04045 [Nitrososphaerota archaeon]|nr:hypothetical protein [Nitrososphaerota archaeon]MDG6990574.1 hypothetical protein [Nitrososphaerota archaeon]
MYVGALSNVPLATANLLAYSMMVLVAIFLVFGASVAYYYWAKSKRMKVQAPADPVTVPA